MAETLDNEELLEPEFMSKLDQLAIVSRRIFAGKMHGERLTKRRGQSVEFADHRNYTVGDDLRFLDWNIYARLEKLFIKLFLQEEDMHVSLLIDTSKSMDWGDPHKGLYARRIAAAMAYIGLSNFDRISLYTYSDGLQEELAGVRGRRLMFKVVEFLTRTQYGGISHLPRAGKQFAMRHPQPGVVIVLSDFMEKSGYEDGLRFLLGRRYDLHVVQLLSPEELEPTLVGDVRLQDVEDDDVAEITVSRALLNRYKNNLRIYCGSLRDYCAKRGVNYLLTSTSVSFDQIILSFFRQRGLVK